MIRRSLLAAALVVAGSVAIAPKAMAQSVDVPFSGTVGGACTFSSVTPGVLGVFGPVGTPTSLYASSFSGPGGPGMGSPGQVSVACNQPASLTVSLPVQTAGPAFIPMMLNADVNSPQGSTYNTTGGSGSPIPLLSDSTNIPLKIGMMADKGSVLEAGNYAYTVTLTVVP
ncbi:MAG: hypothetical protein EAZ77_00675 [Nostocales cyanobacterium]|nr:MAG: hypothetical protein EAZ77_00675 [Nostocales cyanobacterium]